MRYKKQNELKKHLTFQIYHPFNFFENVTILQFLSISYHFWLYLTLMQKLRYTKGIYDLGDSKT